jgi:hypothetical protein
MKVTLNNQEFDFDSVLILMDFELCEYLNNCIAPCTDQEFVDAYCIAHEEKYDQGFVVN